MDELRGSRGELAHWLDQISQDDNPRHFRLHETAVDVFERAARFRGPHESLWGRLVEALSALPRSPECPLRGAVVANTVALAVLRDPQDYLAAASMAVRFGHQRIAQIRNEVDGLLGLGAERPVATAVTWELARSKRIEAAATATGRSAEDAAEVATTCYAAAFWLLMAELDPDRPAPVPHTPEEFRAIIERGGLPEWRCLLSNVAANPWSPEVSRLEELARDADLPAPQHAVEWCAKVYRKRYERSERLEVAREIRRLVAISGCSQREFAQQVGTSPSRLSTYVNGLVTPSAAMMLRISRAANALADSRTKGRRPRGGHSTGAGGLQT